MTFASDDDRFYATLGTAGRTSSCRAIGRRQVKVLAEGVECPSLSPDGTRIASSSALGAASDLSTGARR